MKRKHLILILPLAFAFCLGACGIPPSEPDESTNTSDVREPEEETAEVKSDEIEKLRQEQIEKWYTDGLVQPMAVEAKAKDLLQRPLEQQSVTQLKRLAMQANEAANFVDFILSEYEDYYREHYEHNFVQAKVAPHHDSYA